MKNKLVFCDKCKYSKDLFNNYNFKNKFDFIYYKKDKNNKKVQRLYIDIICIKNSYRLLEKIINPYSTWTEIYLFVNECSEYNKNNNCEFYKRHWFK